MNEEQLFKSIKDLIKELDLEKNRLEDAISHQSFVIKDLSNLAFQDGRRTFVECEHKKNLPPKHPQILLLEQKLKDLDRVLSK